MVRKQFMRRDNCILYAAQDCSGCALKPRCTSAERRLLTRHFHEDALQRMNARLEADPDLMRQRRCAAEHPFGTIKRMTAGGRFLTRGITKVKTEPLSASWPITFCAQSIALVRSIFEQDSVDDPTKRCSNSLEPLLFARPAKPPSIRFPLISAFGISADVLPLLETSSNSMACPSLRL